MHVPNHTPDDIRRTPLLELYRAGRSHQRALSTLIKEAAHGRATVPQTEAFLARESVTLEEADAWLDRIAHSAGREGPDLSALGPDALIEALLPGGTLAATLQDQATERAVWRRAQTLLRISRFRERSDRCDVNTWIGSCERRDRREVNARIGHVNGEIAVM